MKKNIFILCIVCFFLASCNTDEQSQNVFNIDDEVIPTQTTEATSDASFVPTQTPEKQLPLSGRIICIDAGHGLSSDTSMEPIAPGSSETKRAFVSGTSGKNQTEEQLNLRLALKLESLLITYGAQVHMTRTNHEATLSNIGRAEFANNLNADISVKIHADGGNASATGVSMLVPSNKNLNNPELCIISKQAGELILNSVIEETGAKNRGIVERSDMTGFNWSKVPVILIETGFMTNPQEDALLETDEYCNKIITGIANGLIAFFNN